MKIKKMTIGLIVASASSLSVISCFAKEGPYIEKDPAKIILNDVELKVLQFMNWHPPEYFRFTKFTSFPEDYTPLITGFNKFRPLTSELIDVMELNAKILSQEAEYEYSLNVYRVEEFQTIFRLGIKSTLKEYPDTTGTVSQLINVSTKESQSYHIPQNIWKYWEPKRTSNMSQEVFDKYNKGEQYNTLTATIAFELGLNWEKLNSMLVEVPGIKIDFAVTQIYFQRIVLCRFTLNNEQFIGTVYSKSTHEVSEY